MHRSYKTACLQSTDMARKLHLALQQLPYDTTKALLENKFVICYTNKDKYQLHELIAHYKICEYGAGKRAHTEPHNFPFYYRLTSNRDDCVWQDANSDGSWWSIGNSRKRIAISLPIHAALAPANYPEYFI